MRELPLRSHALLSLAVLVFFAACASAPITKTGEIPRGSEIVVVGFRDCLISGQDEDCNGSGVKAGEAFQEAFNEGGKFTSRLVDRPVGPKDALSNEAAAELGRKNGYTYVLHGEVDDFYSVAAMTFRTDRAAATVRIVRATDGQVMASYSKVGKASSNFATPQGMIKDIAIFVRDGL